ncbi:phage integrase central domain-containing protein [Vibrio astriarenae]|uniref:phage integrase central domain-containing protein n=1 Tax=Vibrio astriarenae TaxID=1481923 RepID=UPI003736B891
MRGEATDPATKIRVQRLTLSNEQGNTVCMVAKRWLRTACSRVKHKTAEGYRQKLQLHILPALGEVSITNVTASMLKELMRPREAEITLETINRSVALFQRIMAFAVNNDFIKHNPIGLMRDVFSNP